MIKCLWVLVRLLYYSPRKEGCIRFTVPELGCVHFQFEPRRGVKCNDSYGTVESSDFDQRVPALLPVGSSVV